MSLPNLPPWANRWLPVLVSIGVILLVAWLRNISRAFAAVAAVMPINVPLGMWIVSAGSDDPSAALAEFNEALLVNILPTLVFLVVAWRAVRAGWGLVPTVAVSYALWGVGLALVFWVRGR